MQKGTEDIVRHIKNNGIAESILYIAPEDIADYELTCMWGSLRNELKSLIDYLEKSTGERVTPI